MHSIKLPIKQKPSLIAHWKLSSGIAVVIVLAYVGYARARVCYVQAVSEVSVRSSCGWFYGCSSRIYIPRFFPTCCANWRGSISKGCPTPMCGGLWGSKACTLKEGRTELRTGVVYTESGGVCDSPNVCINCNPGYYSSGPHCKACRAIPNCLHPTCTNGTSSRCAYCEGEVKEEFGWYAYTRFVDSQKSCRQACSWREGSRCYPGNCSDTTLASCSCSDGFSGSDCKTISEDPVLLRKHVRLSHDTGASHEVLEAPEDPAGDSQQDTVWTNNGAFQTAAAYIESLFVKHLPPAPNYVNTEKSIVGIVEGEVRLHLNRTMNTSSSLVLSKSCPLAEPQPSLFRCEAEFDLTSWENVWPFANEDVLTFSGSVTNDGYMTVYDREASNQNVTYDLIGRTYNESFEIGFDFDRPNHCINTSSPCAFQPLVVPDNTTESKFNISWSGWKDGLSGIRTYHVDVYHLRSSGSTHDSLLRQGERVTNAMGASSFDYTSSQGLEHSLAVKWTYLKCHLSNFDVCELVMRDGTLRHVVYWNCVLTT